MKPTDEPSSVTESGSAGRSSPPGKGPEGYEGPGGWGTAAMALLVALLLISVALTVHSLVATLGV